MTLKNSAFSSPANPLTKEGQAQEDSSLDFGSLPSASQTNEFGPSNTSPSDGFEITPQGNDSSQPSPNNNHPSDSESPTQDDSNPVDSPLVFIHDGDSEAKTAPETSSETAENEILGTNGQPNSCLLYTSPSPRD